MSRAPASAVTATLDRDGRILLADDVLLSLQAEAGGAPDGTFALPALADLVRLGLRLGAPLSRAIELARGGTDISLWAQLRPEGEHFHLVLDDWQERRAETQGMHKGPLLGAARAPVEPGWAWQVDDQMRFCRLDLDAHAVGHAVPQDGQTFTTYFSLSESAEAGSRGMPMIEALVRHGDFEGQRAHLRGDGALAYVLSGTAQTDASGVFTGYKGRAVPEAQVRASAPEHVTSRAPQPADEDVLELDVVDEPMPEPATESASRELRESALGRRLDSALRRPISRIIANAGTINERVSGPLRQDYANYAGDISSAGRHLLALVDDLADLQAVEEPDFLPADEDVDLSEVARRAAGLLNIRADARRIAIQVPGEDEQLLARAEYRRVLQILVNLVGNAVRHSPEESTIWIRLDEVDGRARVIVADQGGGIDPPDHDRIFERFERLGNTDGDGSGLGLYISRRLARAMNGDVTIDSALGRGARFTLDLPAWTAGGNSPHAR